MSGRLGGKQKGRPVGEAVSGRLGGKQDGRPGGEAVSGRQDGRPVGEAMSGRQDGKRDGRPGVEAIGGGRHGRNRRRETVVLAALAVFLLAAVTVLGFAWQDAAVKTDFTRKNLAPCAGFLFGTDWMGRDMFVRTLTGLSMSIRLGILTAAVSSVIAFLLGLAAAVLGQKADLAVTGMIDIVMGIPHILLLILISIACGKGFWGVAVGISLTHWTSLARLIRGEVLQLKESQYVKIAEKLGKGPFYIAMRHMAPNLVPQFVTGLILLFPHAILHEASITFLGFGLSPEQPAIGMILSESMKYLAMGKWWLALFPGLLLVGVVLLFHYTGQALCRLIDPGSVHE